MHRIILNLTTDRIVCVLGISGVRPGLLLRDCSRRKAVRRHDCNHVLEGVADPVAKSIGSRLAVAVQPVMYPSPGAYAQSFGTDE
jgi:hypothetical protein